MLRTDMGVPPLGWCAVVMVATPLAMFGVAIRRFSV
jgi:hypothetical protein